MDFYSKDSDFIIKFSFKKFIIDINTLIIITFNSITIIIIIVFEIIIVEAPFIIDIVITII
jgi:hypothetical protein